MLPTCFSDIDLAIPAVELPSPFHRRTATQSIQFRLHGVQSVLGSSSPDRDWSRLIWIVLLKIIKFPFIEFIKLHQLVSFVANSIVARNHVDAGVLVVVVVNGSSANLVRFCPSAGGPVIAPAYHPGTLAPAISRNVSA